MYPLKTNQSRTTMIEKEFEVSGAWIATDETWVRPKQGAATHRKTLPSNHIAANAICGSVITQWPL